MKKILFLILLIIICAGCANNPNRVKLYSQKKVEKIMTKQYGETKIIGIKNSSDDKIEYTCKDVKYGFEYSCSAIKDGFTIDGGSPLWYSSSTTNNYTSAYLDYVFDVEKEAISKIEKEYNVKFEKSPLILRAPNKYDLERHKEAAYEFIEILKNHDDRKLFEGQALFISTDKENLTKIWLYR